MKTVTAGILASVIAASGCASHEKETHPFLSLARDKVSVDPARAGLAYYGTDGKVRLEFLDLDKDGSADNLRVYSAIGAQGCEVMSEDYEADGTPDMRITTCRTEGLGGPHTSRIELHLRNEWLHVEKGQDGPTVMIGGQRKKVVKDQYGRLKIEHAV